MEPGREFSDLADNPAYQLWLATNAWQRRIRRVLRPVGLTHVQFVVLAAVRRLGEGGVNQADVCRFGSLDPNMASQVIRSLSARGLLSCTPHPTDRRAHELRLTPAGAERFEIARALVAPASAEFFAPLGKERPDLARMLRRLAEAE